MPESLQEDVPDEFATLIVNFISRNRIGPHGIEVGISIPYSHKSKLSRQDFSNFSNMKHLGCRYLGSEGHHSYNIDSVVGLFSIDSCLC